MTHHHSNLTCHHGDLSPRCFGPLLQLALWLMDRDNPMGALASSVCLVCVFAHGVFLDGAERTERSVRKPSGQLIHEGTVRAVGLGSHYP